MPGLEPSPNPVVPFDDLEAARRLGDLISIKTDLDHVRASTSLALRRSSARPDDAIIDRALFDSALIAYGRCFTTGRRVRLDEGLFDRDDALEAHRFFISLRDMHLAHRASSFDRARVGVILAHPNDPPRRVLGPHSLFARRVGEMRETVQSLFELADYVRAKVGVEIGMRQEEVRAAAEAIAVDELYAMATPMGLTVPGEEALARPSRRRSGASKTR